MISFAGVIRGFRRVFSQNSQDRRRRNVSIQPSHELLEVRLVPTGLADLTATQVEIVQASLGQRAVLKVSLENQGNADAETFQITLRLSMDSTPTAQDPIVRTITIRGLTAGEQSDVTVKFKLPQNLSAGHYFAVAQIDPQNDVTESNESNNQQVSPQSRPILGTSLEGTAIFGKAHKKVQIEALQGQDVAIDPEVITWVVIHGRNQSADSLDIQDLAKTIDGYQSGDQVLLLNWKKAAASGKFGGQGEDYIQPVAKWAASALQNYGFQASKMNLVGYSWGSYVAEKMAEQLGTVNSLLSIEAARDYPGESFDPDAPGAVDFAAHAEQSWAFFGKNDFFASSGTAATAKESIVISGSDHFQAVPLVSHLLSLPTENGLGSLFALNRLLTGEPQPAWPAKTYDSTGSLVTEDGEFDAVIQATPDGQSPASIRYFDGTSEQNLSA